PPCTDRSAWRSPSKLSRRTITRPDTGCLNIPEVTIWPCQTCSRGSPALTEMIRIVSQLSGRFRDRAIEEFADRGADLFVMSLEREVAGVEESYDGAGIVATKSFRAGRQEERIVLAPHGEQRRPVVAEILLERRIESDVAGVVKEQVKLDLVITRPGQQRRIE